MSKKISLLGSCIGLGLFAFGLLGELAQARPESKPDCKAGEIACQRLCKEIINSQGKAQCDLACKSGAYICETNK